MACSGLGAHKSVSNQENAPINTQTGLSDGANSSVEIPSSQKYLGLCQDDKNYDTISLAPRGKDHHFR